MSWTNMRETRTFCLLLPPLLENMSEDLQQLRDILVGAIDTILGICEQRGCDFPSLEKPAEAAEFLPDGVRNDAKVTDAIKLGVEAADKLIAKLQPQAMKL